jgi:hypothetical protein
MTAETAVEHLDHLAKFFTMLAAKLHHQPQQVHLHGARAGGVGTHHQQVRHLPHPPTHTGNHRVPTPQDAKQLQRYPGVVNFYCRFTQGIEAVLELLTTALKGVKKTL